MARPADVGLLESRRQLIVYRAIISSLASTAGQTTPAGLVMVAEINSPKPRI